MVKFIIAFVVIVAVVGGVAYMAVQPKTLPTPSFALNPEGVAKSTVADIRIRRPGWLASDQNRVWVFCRFGEQQKSRCQFMVDLAGQSTLAILRGCMVVGWINENEILVQNRGTTDSKWEEFVHKFNPAEPVEGITQFFTIDVTNGAIKKICEVSSTHYINAIDISPDGKRVVATWGPNIAYEFQIQEAVTPVKLEEPYVWAPVWIDPETYMFVGQKKILSRKFGVDQATTISEVLFDEIRAAIDHYGSPSVKPCGNFGGNLLLLDQSSRFDYDRLLVVVDKPNIEEDPVEDVTRLISSNDLPRFNGEGDMMVYQGQQYDGNMDTVYLQTVEIDSQPIELVKGEMGANQEATPIFLNDERVLYICRGNEIHSISLADGNIELHWPIDVTPQSED
ncbi:MAG: hypothetical protein KC944_14465 [Candidatus Omnitrophica bacterium]|nr:hypothetical protein [Candidatus Omnitrophota bacterium]